MNKRPVSFLVWAKKMRYVQFFQRRIHKLMIRWLSSEFLCIIKNNIVLSENKILNNKKLKEIAIRLKIARIELGFKKSKDFAKKVSTSPNTYSQYETLKRSLSLENLLKYSSALNINPGWLITGRGSSIDKPVDDSFLEKRISDRVRELEANGVLTSPQSAIIEEDKAISCIESKLFKKVLINIVPLVKDHQQEKTNEEIIDFCFEIYNAIVMSNVQYDKETQQEMITLCMRSFFKGLEVGGLSEIINKVTGDNY